MKQYEKVAAVYCRTAQPDDFATFERPAFLQMCEDIQAGNIQCILVYGISRIGQNSPSVCKWLKEILTGVTVISFDNSLNPYYLIDIG